MFTATMLSFKNMHNHGKLFANMLHERYLTFIVRKKWDLPQADEMEFDQYDTPASRWIVVHNEMGDVFASVRLTPTTHRCGIYTYMIRDAQRGLLETIPSNLLYEQAPVAENIWESSRVFVSPDVPAKERLKVQMTLISKMVKTARDCGATSILGLIPANSIRLARRVGLDCKEAGPILEMDGEQSRCVSISMSTKMH